MRFKLTDKALLRIARQIKGFPFLANPPPGPGGSYKGIEEYPGFHTTKSFEIAASYAVGRVNQVYTEFDYDEDTSYVTDYPVVVQLSMENFSPNSDYDSEKILKYELEGSLTSLLSDNIDENSSDDEIIDAAVSYVENGFEDSEYVDYSNPVDSIFNTSFSHLKNPLPQIIERPDFPDIFRKFITTGLIDSQVLMEAADQYRYLEDVPEDRVKAVWYITPVSSEAVVTDEDIVDNWKGFDVPYEEDLMISDSYDFQSQLVYGSPEANLEYHGTTYKNLLSAAPELVSSLPEPPNPPYRG